MLGGSLSRSQGGGLLEAGAAEPGGRRRRLEELGNLQFANLEETKIKSKVGNLLGRNKNKK